MGRRDFWPPRLLLSSSDFTAIPLKNHTIISSSISGDSENGNNNGDSNFDSNMVIILAALLCALICALGLNSIVRCALRCSRRLALETTADEEYHVGSVTGLKKDALRRIPVVVYKKSGGGVNSVDDISPAGTECAICLGEFKEGEEVRSLPRCNHGFHVNCIDTWLVSHSTCPICRRLLFQHSSSTGAGVLTVPV